MKFERVADVDEIPEGEGRAFEIGAQSIAVFRIGNDFFAIDDRCPHMGASLAGGHLENCVVACPWHAWRFDVRDGTWCDNRRVKTDTFPIRIVENAVYVGVPERSRSSTDSQNLDSKSKSENQMQRQDVETDSLDVTLGDFQRLIHKMYYEKDVARGVEGTFMWLMQEVGELATALRENDPLNRSEEFADVLAWLATIANVCKVDLAAAVRSKYGSGCPGCKKLVCACPNSEKP